MLHSPPNTRQRRYMYFIAWIQRRLIHALCQLPANSTVDAKWLRSIWKDVDEGWVNSFYGNKGGPKNVAMNKVAKASLQTKQMVWESAVQQYRIRKLYKPQAVSKLKVIKWAAPKNDRTVDEEAVEAFSELMRYFYQPHLKSGFVLKAGQISYTSIIEQGMGESSVCPFCDGKLDKRNRVIDHFFPQEAFPALTCFIDNLIPICDTCNGPRGKHDKSPFTCTATNHVNVDDWFHPKWRSAERKLFADVRRNGNKLELKIVPGTANVAKHVTNLIVLTQIDKSWAHRLEAFVRQEQDRVACQLRLSKKNGVAVDRQIVVDALVRWRDYYHKNIGRDESAYKNQGIYDFMAKDATCVGEILKQVNE